MSRVKTLPTHRAVPLLCTVAFLLAAGWSASAQNVQHLSVTQPGGMPGWPILTGIQQVTNGVNVTWDGPSGYYQLYQAQSLKDAKWVAIGKITNLVRTTTVALGKSNAFFRVVGPAPVYAGDHAVPNLPTEVCAECHGVIHDTETNTPHSQAFQALQQIHQDTNSSCLACHTVGYGLPTGFTSAAATPQLENVQCENCHGPAGTHAAFDSDPTVRPRVELAATVCGGCHTGPQHPTYDEWETSGHAAVVPDVAAEMNVNTNLIDSCGRCHSGSARLALLEGMPLPVGDADVAIVCVVCHDPHGNHTFTNVLSGEFAFTNPLTGSSIVITNNQLGALYTNQLRNPICSTNDYFITTSGVFTNQYVANINVCAQCHNHRGASWTNWTRPPHNSPQYNMLLGTVGELATDIPPNYPATHSRLEKQCAACHMQTSPFQNETQPAVTGHSFSVQTYETCVPCHGNQGEALVQFLGSIISNSVSQVKGQLDTWATNASPPALRSYGTLAWEYASPGGLSTGGPGPTNAALQSLISTNIQKARFDLYLVYNDGSLGVHNPFYALTLLETANEWVQEALNDPGD